MQNKTLQEVIGMKREMEQNIYKMFEEFKNATGLTVESVEVHTTENKSGETFFTKIKVNVPLEGDVL